MIDLVECLRKLKKNSNHRFSLFKGRYRSRTNIYLLIYFPVYFICNCQGELWWQGWFMTCYFSLIRFLWYPLGIGRTININIYIYIYIYIYTHISCISWGTGSADACSWPSFFWHCHNGNKMSLTCKTPLPRVTFDELNSLYWKPI